MNKQVPGRLKINSSLENKERKKDLENFSEAKLKHPIIYLLIFKFTWQQATKWKWCWVPYKFAQMLIFWTF